MSVLITGDAGDFDIIVYPSINHLYSDNILFKEEGLPSGAYYLGEIVAENPWGKAPVVVIYDALGCEWIYQDIFLDCDCHNIELITGVVVNDGLEEQYVDGWMD